MGVSDMGTSSLRSLGWGQKPSRWSAQSDQWSHRDGDTVLGSVARGHQPWGPACAWWQPVPRCPRAGCRGCPRGAARAGGARWWREAMPPRCQCPAVSPRCPRDVPTVSVSRGVPAMSPEPSPSSAPRLLGVTAGPACPQRAVGDSARCPRRALTRVSPPPCPSLTPVSVCPSLPPLAVSLSASPARSALPGTEGRGLGGPAAAGWGQFWGAGLSPGSLPDLGVGCGCPRPGAAPRNPKPPDAHKCPLTCHPVARPGKGLGTRIWGSGGSSLSRS